MFFNQIIIFTTSKSAETLSEIFFELGALSVTTEDQFEGTDKEQPIFNEPGMDVDKLWEHSKLTVLFDDSANIAKIIETAISLFGNEFSYSVEQLDDKDWVKLTQNQFAPIKITENLYITPSWHQSEQEEGVTSIILDPGLAFGTGSHPTTFMCLEWIAKNIDHHTTTVLDYGCGSGILAITAKKVGAQVVVGVDIDSQAIESSKYNALTNNADITWYLPKQLTPNRKFSVVIANILSNPLRILAPYLANHAEQTLILSGILESQIDELSAIYSQWFTVTVANIVEGWALLKCDIK